MKKTLIRPLPAFVMPLFFVLIPFISRSQFSSGPLSGTVFSDDNSIGVYGISLPGNAAASDDNRASASALLTLLSGNTHYLRATGFGFNIPAASIVLGIMVEVEKSAVGINLFAWVSDNSVRLVKGGTISGANRAAGGTWTSSEAYHSYGGNSDLWGTGWTAADINSPNFGVVFSAGINGLLTLLPSARIDHIRVTVYYDLMIVPLTITHFSGRSVDEHSARLQWTLSDNNETASINLQRSADLYTWTTINTQPGEKGVMDKSGHYADINCPHDMAFYRLQVQHQSGKVTHSAVVKVEWPAKVFRPYPNPAGSHIFVRQKAPVSFIKCTGLDGRSWSLAFIKIASGLYRADIDHIPPGSYVLTTGIQRSLFLKE